MAFITEQDSLMVHDINAIMNELIDLKIGIFNGPYNHFHAKERVPHLIEWCNGLIQTTRDVTLNEKEKGYAAGLIESSEGMKKLLSNFNNVLNETNLKTMMNNVLTNSRLHIKSIITSYNALGGTQKRELEKRLKDL